MGGRDCGGAFPCFVFILCNAGFCFPPINDSMSSRLLGFERLDLPQLSFLDDGIACFVLHFRNAGAFKTKGREQANLCGLCFAISNRIYVVNREPAFLRAYQSIGQDRRSQTVAENRCLRLFGVQQMSTSCPLLSAAHGESWVRGGIWKGLARGACDVRAAPACDILKCQPFDLASFPFGRFVLPTRRSIGASQSRR